MPYRFAAAVVPLVLVAASASAATQTAPNGFVVKLEEAVKAPPDKVYETLTAQVGAWWSPKHTYSGDARNLSIEARPGGCFCEKLPGGGGVEHMRVVYDAPGNALRMVGALGPLQGSGLAGSLTFTLAADPGGTKLDVSYSVGGFMEGGFEAIAPIVENVLGEQVKRLKRLIETGKADAAPPAVSP